MSSYILGDLTFDEVDMIGELLENAKAGQNEAQGALWPLTPIRLVPAAALRVCDRVHRVIAGAQVEMRPQHPLLRGHCRAAL